LERLVDLDWKLSVGVSSKNCENLQNPFITLILTTEENQIIKKNTLELTLDEFNDFHHNFLQIFNLLDSFN
jgi:hypothetical protein